MARRVLTRKGNCNGCWNVFSAAMVEAQRRVAGILAPGGLRQPLLLPRRDRARQRELPECCLAYGLPAAACVAAASVAETLRGRWPQPASDEPRGTGKDTLWPSARVFASLLQLARTYAPHEDHTVPPACSWREI
ncbi:hypothetical protein PHYPSEUDO_014832 [Phytophthora pseudosyringae]|uniref:Uncharacterized protein n=1 Tax=Phytophthora pseudosyringae TaxID=221518 RepID=A0A8T1V4M3_9STRA|nr:hypothetical protein PHYPSEUDO_014832 [Phytophthora pseudosyringae]